jgi:cellulose synthase/poly-beta-1,6-N-acetylglucosamine synthase-like glycosyltransferase
MTSALVSVVMSVFNSERFLCEAVESILAQTFRDFEFIIINDGSNDCSGDILNYFQKRDARVQLYHQDNRGLVSSLNRGCGLARGKYIARMDADDIAADDRLRRQMDFMESNPQVAVVGGAVEFIDAAGRKLHLMKYPRTNYEIQQVLWDDCALCHPTTFMRREILVALGGYRKIVVHAEDYDLWLRISDKFQLANLDSVVLKYRLHPNQISVRKCKQEGLSGLAARIATSERRMGKPDPLDSIEEITPTTLLHLGATSSEQQRELARQYLRCSRNMYRAGEYSIALLAAKLVNQDRTGSNERWVTADAHLWAAKAHWRQNRFLLSIFMTARAIATRPIILLRPLKPLLLIRSKVRNGRMSRGYCPKAIGDLLQ